MVTRAVVYDFPAITFPRLEDNRRPKGKTNHTDRLAYACSAPNVIERSEEDLQDVLIDLVTVEIQFRWTWKLKAKDILTERAQPSLLIDLMEGRAYVNDNVLIICELCQQSLRTLRT